MVSNGELYPLPDGGLLHKDRLTVILSSEVETVEKEGGVSHHISYFPDIKTITEFSKVMKQYITNIELSSQRASLSASELFSVAKATGGVLIPSHAFTPHKSLYGNAGRRLREVFKENAENIPAIELGLSADSGIADHLEELNETSFLSNSDAHSIPKIAREYNIIEMKKPNFREFILALHRNAGRRIAANIGMDPRLGRYHRTCCLKCGKIQQSPPPVFQCQYCGNKNENKKDMVKGVLDRIMEIGDYKEPKPPDHRPPYHYQIPLAFVPGLSEKIMNYLLQRFGSEMAILNIATDKEIKSALPPDIARNLIDARNGRLDISSGGGGMHGKIEDKELGYEELTLGF
jgi:uncharacterized protein (TIGR00375 family)